ncbi:MAG: M23 family metallopeptidase [Bacteroidota bacterium]
MRITALLTLFSVLTFAFSLSGGKNYPQDYFRSPVDQRIRLSGTFGELRPNHLHAGIDIKGKVGQSLYAAAEGYISRIKVQAGGYGNVVYMNHPNGYTSVYAHLHKFTPEVEQYVREFQYKRESFEVEIFPGRDKFRFAKGDVIGKLGLSGRSFGPHLHFEIRDTKSERPINPLLFGMEVKDDRPPKLHQLKVYHLNDKRETVGTRTLNLIMGKAGPNYRIKGDTLDIGAWRAGFALKAYDHMTGVPNWNGIYSLAMFKDDILIYDFEMETFSFSESRYINAHLDYAEQVEKKSYFNRCYQLPGNKLSIYNEQVEQGVVKLHKGKVSEIKMLVQDVDGNRSQLRFWVRRAEVKPPKSDSYNYLLPYNEENKIDNESLYLYFPEGTFYENVYLKYHNDRERSSGLYSAVHHIHNRRTPVHRYFDLGLRPDQPLPEAQRSKAFIAHCQPDGTVENMGGSWKNGRLQTKTRAFGKYCIMLDQKAPTITPVAFRTTLKGYSKMSFKIKDNFEASGRAAGLSYRATVDGQWILLEYDAKKDLLIHRFDGSIGPGEHQLRLVVSDNRGNERLLERRFIR